MNAYKSIQRPSALLFVVAMLTLTGCEPETEGRVDYRAPQQQPEMATGWVDKPGWEKDEYAVSAAHPLAADAGAQVIENGGSAVDAAVAVQLVLTLVEPQSSGIGGGAFMLHWDGQQIDAYNGRETAPSAAGETLFLDEDGETMPFMDAVASGKSVGVPGTLALLEQAHSEHGSLPWAEVFRPAITLAEEGFEMGPRLSRLLQGADRLRQDDLARDFYFDEEGNARPEGYRLQNPALAEVLRRVAAEGIEAFYRGPVAESIAERVQNHPERPGEMTLEDISAYLDRNLTTESICTPYRDYEVCGFPPPTSGHLAVMQILGVLEHLDQPQQALQDSVPSGEWLHQYMEAAKLSFADRNRYVGDPAYVDPPGDRWQSMLDPDYLASRADLVSAQSMGEAEPGTPGELALEYGRHPEQPEKGTSHFTIIDRDGNAVSMTTTIEQGFGSRIMSDGGTGLDGGFLLNNELTDFSLEPEDEQGRPIANRVEGGKQPRSSMSPTLLFDGDSGELLAGTGSPGGTSIIHYTAKTVVAMLDWDMNAQQAADLANFSGFNSPQANLEAARFPDEVMQALEQRGHEVSEGNMTSGLHIIQRLPDGTLYGGADPRREGWVEGR